MDVGEGVKPKDLAKENEEYWKKQYFQLKELYDDKMRELNEYGYIMQQFSRETFTKAQKQELQRKIEEGLRPASDPRLQAAAATTTTTTVATPQAAAG
jgi:hypothetical protein